MFKHRYQYYAFVCLISGLMAPILRWEPVANAILNALSFMTLPLFFFPLVPIISGAAALIKLNKAEGVKKDKTLSLIGSIIGIVLGLYAFLHREAGLSLGIVYFYLLWGWPLIFFVSLIFLKKLRFKVWNTPRKKITTFLIILFLYTIDHIFIVYNHWWRYGGVNFHDRSQILSFACDVIEHLYLLFTLAIPIFLLLLTKEYLIKYWWWNFLILPILFNSVLITLLFLYISPVFSCGQDRSLAILGGMIYIPIFNIVGLGYILYRYFRYLYSKK